MTVSRLVCVAALVGLSPLAGRVLAAQQITPEDPASDSVDVAAAKQVLTTELAAFGLAQVAYHKAYGSYAASVRQLRLASSFVLPPDVSVIVVSSTPDGWSAIAAGSGAPEVRCVTYSGKAKPPFDDRLADSDVSCRSENYPPKPRADTLLHVSTQRPQQLRCEVRRLPFRLPHPGRVTLQFVLDKDGHPEPTSVRFLTSPDLLDDLSALVVLSGCEYRAAQVDGKSVRVLIQQPIDLRP